MDDIFIDAESNWTSNKNDEISFRMILMEHLRRVVKLGSKEFRGGYFEKRPVLNGQVVIDVYQPDTRAEYINAVDKLCFLLTPYFDKDTIKKVSLIREKIKKAIQDYKNQCGGKDYSPGVLKEIQIPMQQELFIELSAFMKSINYLLIDAITE